MDWAEEEAARILCQADDDYGVDADRAAMLIEAALRAARNKALEDAVRAVDALYVCSWEFSADPAEAIRALKENDE